MTNSTRTFNTGDTVELSCWGFEGEIATIVGPYEHGVEGDYVVDRANAETMVVQSRHLSLAYDA
jgi:hypothetical protein